VLCAASVREANRLNAVENAFALLLSTKGFGLLVVHLDELQDGRSSSRTLVRTSFDLAFVIVRRTSGSTWLSQELCVGVSAGWYHEDAAGTTPEFPWSCGWHSCPNTKDGKIGRNGTIDLLQEFGGTRCTMAWPALPITDPVAMSKAAKRLVVPWRFVIVGAALDLAGQSIGRIG